MASLILLPTKSGLPVSNSGWWTPVRLLQWELLQLQRRVVDGLRKRLFEREVELAMLEREWAAELNCPAAQCGACKVCERHEFRRQFDGFDTTEGMIPGQSAAGIREVTR